MVDMHHVIQAPQPAYLIGIIIIPKVQRFLSLTQFPITLPNPGPYGTACHGQGPSALSLFPVHVLHLLDLTETWMIPENTVSCSPLGESPCSSFALLCYF